MDVTVGPEDSHDMGKIRGAYKSGDVEASKQAHAQGYAEADVHSGAKSEYIKSITFGGLDGIITTFAVVAAGAGAELEARVIILLGCANLVSDGISMGLGDFFSEKAEAEGEEAERKRMVEIVSSYPSTALRVITEHFVTSKGFSRQHAETMLRRYAGYQGHFVDMIVSEERLPDKLEAAAEKAAPESSDDKAADTEEEAEEEEEDAIWKQGLITTAAFWAFGAIPVVAFAIASWFGATKMTCFVVDIVCTLLTLAGLGVVQAKITRESAVKKAGQMVCPRRINVCHRHMLLSFFQRCCARRGAY
jgi:VIT1/CCC1 family predicted Fe2+/Mn2+ transporter